MIEEKIKNIILRFFIMLTFTSSILQSQVSTTKILSKVFNSLSDSTTQYFLNNYQGNKNYLIPSEHTLTISSDFEMGSIFIFTEENLNTFIFRDTTQYSIQLQPGKYNFVVNNFRSKHTIQFYYMENILVNTDSTIHLSESNISIQNEYSFLRENSSKIRINYACFSFSFRDKEIGIDKRASFGYVIHTLDSTSFNLRYNKLPEILTKEWAFQGRNQYNQNLYLLNGIIEESSTDTLFTNNIDNWAYADFQYFFEDSIMQKNEYVQVATRQPSGYLKWGDEYLTKPYILRVYQDISNPDSSFYSRFYQSVNATQIDGIQYYTSLRRIYKDYVQSYKSPENYSNPLTIQSNHILCGVTPVFWNGRFNNTSDSIRIEAPFGLTFNDYLFVSQSMDVINQSPFEYYLFENGMQIKIGTIGDIEQLYLIGGAILDTLSFKAKPEKYKYLIINDKVEVAGIAGGIFVEADFNLSKEDKNPPYIDYFQITEDEIITNKIHSFVNTKIKLKIYDDSFVDEVKLELDSHTNSELYVLDIIENPPWYEASIPVLPNDVYSLNLIISDSTGNCITVYMDPVFIIDAVTEIENHHWEVSSFKIISVSPNPFNSTTKLTFELDNNLLKKLSVNIYDILGRKVKTFNGPFKNGKNSIFWDGTNNQNKLVSSGIYILILKTENIFKSKKLILLK